jgi:hypothetical protein
MREPNFKQFRSELLQAGIAPRHIRRTMLELQDHLDDLVEAELASGCDAAAARRRASREMGNLTDVAIAMRACPELQCWAYRYPRLAIVIYPLTCLALLPIVPVIAGVTHAEQVARWGVCLFFGALVTASMFLILQLAIALP